MGHHLPSAPHSRDHLNLKHVAVTNLALTPRDIQAVQLTPMADSLMLLFNCLRVTGAVNIIHNYTSVRHVLPVSEFD